VELRKTQDLRDASFAEKVGQKLTIILIILLVALLLSVLVRRFGLLDIARLRLFIEGTGPWAPLVLIGLITWGTISLTIPSTPAIIISGILYGPLLGSLYALIGILLGASIMFFVARYFRSYIIEWLGSHAEILLRFQHKYVAGVVFFTRAIPLFSFEVISYAAGLTGIRYGAYIIATTLGILPVLFLYATSAQLILEFAGDFFPIVMAVIMILMVFIIPLAIEHYNPFGWKEKLLSTKQDGGARPGRQRLTRSKRARQIR
jgi:uncharacterized membrane protein YdjX (TVP38/TMEM64 family)